MLLLNHIRQPVILLYVVKSRRSTVAAVAGQITVSVIFLSILGATGYSMVPYGLFPATRAPSEIIGSVLMHSKMISITCLEKE